MAPERALFLAIETGLLRPAYGPRGARRAPGQVILHMTPEAREALQELTSDRLAKIRVEPWEIS